MMDIQTAADRLAMCMVVLSMVLLIVMYVQHLVTREKLDKIIKHLGIDKDTK